MKRLCTTEEGGPEVVHCSIQRLVWVCLTLMIPWSPILVSSAEINQENILQSQLLLLYGIRNSGNLEIVAATRHMMTHWQKRALVHFLPKIDSSLTGTIVHVFGDECTAFFYRREAE
jgi:hypothetical protein